MFVRLRRCSLLALLLSIGSVSRADDQTSIVVESTRLLEEISSKPDSGIPRRILREAQGVLIIPHMVENLVGIGREKGRGVFLSRGKNGEWESAEPVKVMGLSLGAQAGRMVTDRIVLYATPEAADTHGKFIIELGAKWGAWSNRRDRFSGPGSSTDAKESVRIYTRRQGLVLRVMVGVEITTDSSPPRLKSKTEPAAGKTGVVADGARRIAKSDDAVSRTKVKTAADSPELIRLKKTLTAMTRPLPANVAKVHAKDTKVGVTNGPKPLNP